MKWTRWAWGTGLFGLALLLAGCATARRSEALAGGATLDTPQLRHGREVFMTHCQQCHPGGDAGVGPALNNKPLPGFLIKTQVRLGLGSMPSFKKTEISPEDLDATVAFLKAVRKKQVPPPVDKE